MKINLMLATTTKFRRRDGGPGLVSRRFILFNRDLNDLLRVFQQHVGFAAAGAGGGDLLRIIVSCQYLAGQIHSLRVVDTKPGSEISPSRGAQSHALDQRPRKGQRVAREITLGVMASAS